MSLAIRSFARRGNATDIGEDDVYEILGNPRRRHALRYLRECGRPVPVGELAEHVAAAEHDIPVAEVTHGQRKSAYTALYQNHLVKLADAGFVRADRRWADVELTAAAARLDFDVLARDDDAPRPNPRAVALSLFGLGATASCLLGVLSPSATLASFGALSLVLFTRSTYPYLRPVLARRD